MSEAITSSKVALSGVCSAFVFKWRYQLTEYDQKLFLFVQNVLGVRIGVKILSLNGQNPPWGKITRTQDKPSSWRSPFFNISYPLSDRTSPAHFFSAPGTSVAEVRDLVRCVAQLQQHLDGMLAELRGHCPRLKWRVAHPNRRTRKG